MRLGTAAIAITIAAATLAVAVAQTPPSAFPNASATPGALNPAVTPATIFSTICARGWTRTIRPAEARTEALKRQQLYDRASPYFAPGYRLRQFEEDHRVPLGVGGAPADPRNLWPEPRFGYWSAGRKDELEGLINYLVCAGRITLAEGRAAFLGDWTAADRRYAGAP